ncbi:hypothetical protein B0H13DRAFT_2332947 [Mycena leptocephala]|nr:hypothetical protein B0H13DRAFT_2332947 [Mycena leptocephala]
MDPAVSFNLNVTLGAYQIGILLSYVLFGVTTTQMYIYYTRFPNDPLKLKSLVAFVWACEFAHALCIGHNLYVWTISSYGHPERVLGRAPDSFGVSIFLSGVIAVCVPAFFSFRIYTLSKQLYIPVLTWTMVFLRLLGTSVLFVATFQMKSLLASIAQWEWLTTATLSVGMANDLTIAASLVLILHKQRHNGLKRTAVLVDKMILWTLETGMLTSVTSVVELACYVTMKDNFFWMAIFVVLPRTYSNSFLASLNSRATLRAMDELSLSISLRPSTTPAVSHTGDCQV